MIANNVISRYQCLQQRYYTNLKGQSSLSYLYLTCFPYRKNCLSEKPLSDFPNFLLFMVCHGHVPWHILFPVPEMQGRSHCIHFLDKEVENQRSIS